MLLDRTPLSLLDGELDAMLQNLMGPVRARAAQAAGVRQGYRPLVDVREEADRIVLTADLPGVRSDDVSLTLENGVLTLAGERREADGRPATYHRWERPAGRFERRFALPAEVDGERIDASYQDGVLTVTLPKRPDAQRRTIEIKK